MKLLVTGGAGFIGSFIVDELIKRKHKVRILDNLVEQVHRGKVPDYLNKNAEFIKGDVQDKKAFSYALKDIDFVFHEAAEVGVGQSMYEISRYVNTNAMGTANLLNKNKIPVTQISDYTGSKEMMDGRVKTKFSLQNFLLLVFPIIYIF